MIGEAELAQLDLVLARSPLAVVAWDERQTFSYWSSRAQAIFGFEAAQMLGQLGIESPIVHPDDRTRLRELQDGLTPVTARDLVTINRNVRADGASRTCRWTIFAVQEDEPTYRTIGFVEDVTGTIEAQTALLESEARFHSLFENNPDPVLALDLDGTMIACNDAAVRVSGLPRAAILGQSYARFLGRRTGSQAREAFKRATTGTATTLAFATRNGEGREIEVTGTIIPQFSQEQVVGIFAIFQDITDRCRAERRAEMQRRRMRDLYFIAASGDRPELRIRASLAMGSRAFELNIGAVVQLGADSPRVSALHRAPSAQGLPDGQLIAMARAACQSEFTGAPVVSPRGVATRLEVAGATYGALVFASTLEAAHDFSETDADLLGLISTLIAGALESDRARTQLRTLAYYDGLTGLPNRAYLAEKVRDAIEIAESRLAPIALLFLDLDGFKDVNDTLGHARGDRLLQLVAQRLAQTVEGGGAIARMGGDEFVVLLPEAHDSENAEIVAKRILASLSEPFAIDEYEQFISTSIGIAMYPEDGRDDQTLIKNADIAMSRAKDRGRNGYFFYKPTLEAPIHMRLSQQKLLRRALELDEFVVFYQPQLDLRTGRVASIEALVRWNHPKSGLILPAQFIPSAEISGLIGPLGDWVLATAARQVRAWQATLGPIRLAVNLSAREFHDRDLRTRIVGTLAQARLGPEYLEVEITESVAMADAAQSAQIVRDLCESGIRIAVDDFGTGYSSLAYLSNFSLDVLKIDGSFVAGVGRSSGDETIVNTVIGMAHSLDLEVVAEGVETHEQLAFLTGHGCDIVQGFAIAPAMPASEFEAFLIAHRASVA